MNKQPEILALTLHVLISTTFENTPHLFFSSYYNFITALKDDDHNVLNIANIIKIAAEIYIFIGFS